MSEPSDDPDAAKQESHADPQETLPKPQSADIPPLDWLNEDRMDSIENARRTASERWRTDMVLLAAYLLATIVLIVAIVLARHHHFHH
jgi:hypothetical protein